ncbi:hypothetical protein V8C44DRAFT_91583 [Trichoderma aethiopicum]
MRRKEDEDQSGDEMESPKEERSRWVGNRDDQEAVSPQGARRTCTSQYDDDGSGDGRTSWQTSLSGRRRRHHTHLGSRPDQTRPKPRPSWQTPETRPSPCRDAAWSPLQRYDAQSPSRPYRQPAELRSAAAFSLLFHLLISHHSAVKPTSVGGFARICCEKPGCCPPATGPLRIRKGLKARGHRPRLADSWVVHALSLLAGLW